MSIRNTLLVVLLGAWSAPLSLAQPPGMGGQEREILDQFDADQNSWLNKEERQEARTFLKENPPPRRGFGGPPGARAGWALVVLDLRGWDQEDPADVVRSSDHLLGWGEMDPVDVMTAGLVMTAARDQILVLGHLRIVDRAAAADLDEDLEVQADRHLEVQADRHLEVQADRDLEVQAGGGPVEIAPQRSRGCMSTKHPSIRWPANSTT